jgi:metallopeptidase MepB
MSPGGSLPAVLALASGALALHLASPDAGLGPGHLFSDKATHSLSKRLVGDFADIPEKYKNPPQVPPVWNHTILTVVREAELLCNETTALYDRLAASIAPANGTFQSVLLPITEDDAKWATWSNALYFYQYVSPDEVLRDASTNASTLMDNYSIEVSTREDIFKLVDSVHSRLNTTEAALDAESRRLVERTRKGYISSGLSVPAGEKRDRFKAIRQRISEVELLHAKNLNEETGSVWFTAEELDGVPKDVIDAFEKGTGDNAGKLRVTFKYPDLNPTMRFSKNPETRRKMYWANENRVSLVP